MGSTRPFEELNVSASGVQDHSGRVRFPHPVRVPAQTRRRENPSLNVAVPCPLVSPVGIAQPGVAPFSFDADIAADT
jgi:hypothetical protein